MARTSGKLFEFALGRFGKGIVSLTLAESLFEKGEDNYEVITLLNQGRIQAESGGKPEQVFVATGLLAQLVLLNNQAEEAAEMVQSLRTTAVKDAPQMLAGIDAFLARICLYTGRIAQAGAWLQNAPDEEAEFCSLERYRYMTKARIYLALGKKSKALSLLQRMRSFAEKRQRTYIYIEATILLAIAQYRLGLGPWQETLQEAIDRAGQLHFVRIFSREATALMELFRAGSFTWPSEKYRQQVLSECKQVAGFYPGYLAEKEHVVLQSQALRILKLQAQGLSNSQIAQHMGLSEAGVKYYNSETYRKLGVKSKTAAIAEARNRKLI